MKIKLISFLRYKLKLGVKLFSRSDKRMIITYLSFYERALLSDRLKMNPCYNLSYFMYSNVSEDIFEKFKLKYLNVDYLSQYMNIQYPDALFWWPAYDYESRLKAVGILRHAIIND